jgi:nitrate reductase gamma subunit
MGIALTLCTYLVMLLFLGVSISRFLTLWEAWRAISTSTPRITTTPVMAVKMVGDIFFLGRLMRTSDLLWMVEWSFHFSFAFVVLRHLRYILNPVPGWVWWFQTPGLIAGYVLPVSLICIFIMKMSGEREYLSSYNLFLVILLFLIGTSGLLLKTIFHPDIVATKNFMIGVFTFTPSGPPRNLLFVVHYVLVLVLFAFLPSHMFTAPFVIMEARKREDGLEAVMHEER